jgi:hypothetical protein
MSEKKVKFVEDEASDAGEEEQEEEIEFEEEAEEAREDDGEEVAAEADPVYYHDSEEELDADPQDVRLVSTVQDYYMGHIGEEELQEQLGETDYTFCRLAIGLAHGFLEAAGDEVIKSRNLPLKSRKLKRDDRATANMRSVIYLLEAMKGYYQMAK